MVVVQFTQRSEVLVSLHVHACQTHTAISRSAEHLVSSGKTDSTAFVNTCCTHADYCGHKQENQSCDVQEDDSQEQQQHLQR